MRRPVNEPHTNKAAQRDNPRGRPSPPEFYRFSLDLLLGHGRITWNSHMHAV
jgi:hypothetical protein